MALILVIDDNSDMLDMLEIFFVRRTLHEVVLSHSGKEGLEQAFNRPPDIVVVDVMMPEMDGYEVVRRLRADERTKNAGILVLTARGQPVDQAAALEAGADAHLSKPVNMQQLGETIEELLRKREDAPAPKPIVVPVMSLKGGVGVTTLAVNLAIQLQQVAPTTLWDLSPNSGHVALMAGLQPRTHWGDWVQDTRQPITPFLRQHETGLQILCAPPVPTPYVRIGPAAAAKALQGLAIHSNYIVIDLPPALDDTAQQLLAVGDLILLVTGDDAPAIQTTLATLQALKNWRDKIAILHNAGTPGPRLDIEKLQRTMRVTIQAQIPYDPNQVVAIRKGIPLTRAQPQSPFAVAIQGVAQQVLQSQGSKPQPGT